MKKSYFASAFGAFTLTIASLLGGGVTSAQTGEQPAATAIPFAVDSHLATPAPQKASVVKPASVDIAIWSPDGGQLTVTADKVTARASSTIAFDLNSARYYLITGSTIGAEQIPDAAYDNANKGVALTANVAGTGVTGVIFSIKDTDGTKFEKQFSIGVTGGGSRKIWTALAMSDYFYPPLNLSSFTGNNGPCAAVGPLVAGRAYQSPSGGSNDWYFVNTNLGDNVKVTIDNPPTNGTQLQVINADSQDCTKSPTLPTAFVELNKTNTIALSNVKAGRVYVRIASSIGGVVFNTYGIRIEGAAQNELFEDNDTPCQATKTTQNTIYNSFIDDEYDFYEIVVPASGFVRMYLENYNAPSQMQFRSSQTNTACSPTASTVRIGDPSFVVSGKAEYIKWVTAGTYYARIGPTTQTNTAPYKFNWNFQAQASPQVVDLCSALTGCSTAPLYGLTKFTLYRGNFPVETANFPAGLLFETDLVTEKVGACPAGSPNQRISFSTAAKTGSREYGSLAKGYYKLKVRVYQGVTTVHYSEHAIKMDCEFLSTTSSNTQSSTQDADPQPIDAPRLPGAPTPAP